MSKAAAQPVEKICRDGMPVRCLRPIGAIVFDLDGTLADTADDIAHALGLALGRESLPPMSTAKVRQYIGYGGTTLVTAALRDAGVSPGGALIDRVQDAYAREYGRLPTRLSYAYPGTGPLLKRLRRVGVPLAVCTNKLHAQATALLHDLQIEAHFACVAAPDTCGYRKPDPRILLSAMEELGVGPDRVLLVGDTEVDVMTARAAGAFAGLVTFGFGGQAAADLGPDMRIDDYATFEDRLATSSFFLQRRAAGNLFRRPGIRKRAYTARN